ncbi:MAG: hypothetical protein WDZ46_00900 [Solirubrobacterales bacterium]
MDDMDEIRTPASEDTAIEAAVLRHLLALHPTLLTLEELDREIVGEAAGFAEKDAVERAVGQLAAAGLAHCGGDIVRPTRAALRLDELFE